MSANGDWLPTWFQFGLATVIAAVSGAAGMVTTALSVSRRLNLIEKSISDGLNSLRLHADAGDSRRFHDLVAIIQRETMKSQAADDRIEQRIGALEQDQAVMRDFKKRMEALAERR